MAMAPETIRFLDERGFVRDSRVIVKDIAARLAEAVAARPCNEMIRVETDSPTVAEWRVELLGTTTDPLVEHELNQLIGRLLTIGPKGSVQKALENGHVLCKTDVRRTDENGEAKIKKGAGRVVSSDPDIIERYHDIPKATELTKKAQSTRASFDLSARRVPALASRHSRVLPRTQEETERYLLGSGEDS